MIEESQNKMITGKEVKKKDAQKEEYFFPEFGVTIIATSREEAEAKLQELNAKK